MHCGVVWKRREVEKCERRRTDLCNISESFSFWLWLSSNVDSSMRLSENCSFNQTSHLRRWNWSVILVLDIEINVLFF